MLINNCLGANNYKYFVQICYLGMYMALMELLSFTLFYLDLTKRESQEC